MASVFQKIGNFLNKDEVRLGLGIASAAGGFGAYDGMKYGSTINKALGGLNLASGLKAGGASGALQAGLGGYGLAQGFGKVGTFGNRDNLFGAVIARIRTSPCFANATASLRPVDRSWHSPDSNPTIAWPPAL